MQLLLIQNVAHLGKQGDVVETGTAQEIFDAPKTDYTRTLMAAAFGEVA